jgi:hypothetical protein
LIINAEPKCVETSGTLIPTRFERGVGQVDGGIINMDPSAARGVFPAGRVQNLSDQGSQPFKVDHKLDMAIFAGYAISQFGHFLVESLGRIPSFPRECSHAPLLFLSGGLGTKKIQPWQIDLLRSFGIENQVILVQRPTRVERMLIPPLHFHLNLRPFGDKIGKKWASQLFPPCNPSPKKRIYVSRTHLNKSLGHISNEGNLETLLSDFGYEIVHPQELSVEEQIKIYRSAEQIVLAESSAIHLMNIVCSAGCEIAIIQRRPKLHPSIRRAVQYFSRSSVICIDAVQRFETRHPGRSGNYTGLCDLNIEEVKSTLAFLGFISHSNALVQEPVRAEFENYFVVN